ncbi:hypothetical protein BGZ76_008918 [Entomortierella beljakovae]|nr:hypothetical protein BGZ76_008918 [Entomortierella beljakovae]
MRSLDLAHKVKKKKRLRREEHTSVQFVTCIKRGQVVTVSTRDLTIKSATLSEVVNMKCEGGHGRELCIVFSTSSSIESLVEYSRQQSHQQPTTTAELLNENLALIQKNALAQQEVNSVRNNQIRLENQVYELDQSLAESRKESQRLLRAKKDNERQLEQRNAAFERERVLWIEREAELVRNLKFATRPLIVQAPAKDDRSDIEFEPMDALPPQIQQQIAENNAAHARTLKAQEKIAAKLQQQIISMNQEMLERQQHFELRASELQDEIIQTRDLNTGLMEENESYQLLLHEKSMNGEFMQTNIMKSTRYDDQNDSQLSTSNNGSVNLADELGRAFNSPQEERTVESLSEEIKSLKDQNSALNLYVAKILTRIMNQPGFTAVLAADYSPGRATVPESPPSVIKSSNNSSSRGSDNDSKDEDKSQAQKKVPHGRARSQSFLQAFWAPRTKPASQLPTTSASGKNSTRNSSEDDSASSSSAKITSFHDGHTLEDSPRASNSSSEYTAVAQDHSPLPDFEELTTFANPFPRKELQRHASVSAAQDRHKRRQTIGVPGAAHLKGSHGRYVSESSATPSGNSRRSMIPPTKNNLSILPPMPESQSHNLFSPISESPVSPYDQIQESESMNYGSPALSISTSDSSSSNITGGALTPTTPVTGEGGILRKFRRFSMFGASNPNGSEDILQQQTQPVAIADNAREAA